MPIFCSAELVLQEEIHYNDLVNSIDYENVSAEIENNDMVDIDRRDEASRKGIQFLYMHYAFFCYTSRVLTTVVLVHLELFILYGLVIICIVCKQRACQV